MTDKNIECEIRSFITNEEYERLLRFFKQEAREKESGEQITYYFDTPHDLRIQRNNHYSKIWLKSGSIHSEHREETEIRCKQEDFPLLEKLFAALGYAVSMKWFRNRIMFEWGDITVALDNTKGYGRIIELEKMSSKEHADATVEYLKQKLQELDIRLTPKKEFEERFAHYKKHWQELI